MLLAIAALKNWFSSRKKANDIAEPLKELPLENQEKIQNCLLKINPPNVIIETLNNSLEKAIANWLDNPSASNSLVVLTSPVEPIDRFLISAVEKWKNPHNLPINWLSLPPASDPEIRKKQLAAALDKIEDSSERKLAIASDLSNGFLRCIGGLAGIDSLRDKMEKNQECFWLIGCNTWAWEYLNKTNFIQAALEETLPLPNLEGEELQEWLKPLSNLVFKDEQTEKEYFKKLAKLSLGQSEVAKELWFLSLGCDREVGDCPSFPEVKTRGANLPQFSQISLDYCYLFYSLLLHKTTSISCLAVSLGENKNRIRELLRQGQNLGLVKKERENFEVNPLYYPQLYSELKRNNFLVAPDDDKSDRQNFPAIFVSNK